MVTPRHSIVGSFFQDPRTDSGAINDGAHTFNGEPSTFLGKQVFGGHDYSRSLQRRLRPSFVARRRRRVAPRAQLRLPSDDRAGTRSSTSTRAIATCQTGGFGLIQDKDFKR